MQKIKEIRHVVLGIAFSPTGVAQGGKSVDEVNKIVTDIGKDYNEVTINVVKNSLDERGDPSFLLNEYVFVKYEDEAVTARAKKSDA